MTDSIDQVTSELVDMFHKRRIPALFISQNTTADKPNVMRTKYTGSVEQLGDLVSAAVMVYIDCVSKQFNLPEEDATNLVMEAIEEHVAMAKATRG